MSDAWTELFITYDEYEAEIVKDVLESGGFTVVIRSSKATPYPVNVGKMGEVKILVREEFREKAEKVLENFVAQRKTSEQQE